MRSPHSPDLAKTNRLHLRRLLWPVALLGLIWLASSRSQVASPELTRWDDKFAHFAVYGLVGTLTCRIGSGWRVAAWSLIAVSSYGLLDEWHQSFVPGRSCDVFDWVADTLGAAVGIALYTGWPWYRRGLETPLKRAAD